MSAGETMTMTLDTFPAEDVEPLISDVHPCMLHVVRMGTGKRYNWLEPVPTKIHWRQTFTIQDGKVWVVNTTSELDVGRAVPNTDIVTKLVGNSIILGKNKEHLNMVFLKPKQTNCDATISLILGNRLNLKDEAQLKKYTSCFTGKNKENMMRIRLKATFYKANGEEIASTVSPQTVVDNGNKKIGCMDMYDAWPRKSCSQGGRKVMMISEYDLADDVEPIFEVYDAQGNHRVEIEEQNLIAQPKNSPTTKTVKNSTIIFLTPAQPNLQVIQEIIGNFTTKLVAKRMSDGLVSNRAFPFQYTKCHSTCDHTIDGPEEAKIEHQERAKPNNKKRNMKERTPLQVVPTKKDRRDSVGSSLLGSDGGQSPGTCDMMGHSPAYSGSQGYMSSPEHTPWTSYGAQSVEELPGITVTLTTDEINSFQIPSGEVVIQHL